MDSLTEHFDLERVTFGDVRALGGEVIEVPVKPNKIAAHHVEELGEDLARFMCSFTGRGYGLTRETSVYADTRYVREPGYDSYGLKLFVDGNRIVIGRVAVLMDETILTTYVRHLRALARPKPEPPEVVINMPDNFRFGEPESPGESGKKPTEPDSTAE
jgi:hypothetical protein